MILKKTICKRRSEIKADKLINANMWINYEETIIEIKELCKNKLFYVKIHTFGMNQNLITSGHVTHSTL